MAKNKNKKDKEKDSKKNQYDTDSVMEALQRTQSYMMQSAAPEMPGPVSYQDYLSYEPDATPKDESDARQRLMLSRTKSQLGRRSYKEAGNTIRKPVFDFDEDRNPYGT